MYVRNGLISLSKRERNSLRSACLGSLGWIKLQLSLLRDPELLPVLAEHFCGSSIYRWGSVARHRVLLTFIHTFWSRDWWKKKKKGEGYVPSEKVEGEFEDGWEIRKRACGRKLYVSKRRIKKLLGIWMMFVSDPGDGKQSFRKMNETLTISQAWSLWIHFRRTARNVFFLSIPPLWLLDFSFQTLISICKIMIQILEDLINIKSIINIGE